MGRSSKAKISKRLKASRRALLDEQVAESTEKQNKRLAMIARGFDVIEKPKVNAFLHPNDPNAEFPQKKIQKIVDFRSNKNEFSGMEYRGAMRDKSGPKDIVYAKMVGEPDNEMIKTGKQPKAASENDEELLNELLNMKINNTGNKQGKKISKMVVEGTKKSGKFKKVACKKLRRSTRF